MKEHFDVVTTSLLTWERCWELGHAISKKDWSFFIIAKLKIENICMFSRKTFQMSTATREKRGVVQGSVNKVVKTKPNPKENFHASGH